jgi:glycosyltransferase involved in cell wall biosynthesis
MKRSAVVSAKAVQGLPLSVVILTHNEEKNLPGCLCSLAGFAKDVHVLDSGSTDSTVEVAKRFGVAIHTNPFRGFGQQRNWAIDNIPHLHPWVLHLDADERMTPELATELQDLLAAERPEAGFFVASKLMLGGRWLRYSSGYPVYQVRLFHRDRLRFEDHGHGQREVPQGSLGYLRNAYLHEAYSKGLDDWFAKHARYARCEADQLRQERQGICAMLGQLFSSDPVVRRRAHKWLAYKLPGRPTLRLIQLLIFNRGLLDGSPGLLYARMMAAYESILNTYLTRDETGVDI